MAAQSSGGSQSSGSTRAFAQKLSKYVKLSILRKHLLPFFILLSIRTRFLSDSGEMAQAPLEPCQASLSHLRHQVRSFILLRERYVSNEISHALNSKSSVHDDPLKV